MIATQFQVHEFTRSRDPWQYILDSGIMEISTDSVRREMDELRREWEQMDEFHLAFALPIVERHGANDFRTQATRLLDHSSLSVRINAQRVIDAIEN